MQNTSIPYNKLCKETNKQTCEALDCLNEAIIEIKIDAGKFGNIPLLVCKNCLPRFSTKGAL
jgi:hypothetical protein